MRGGYAVALQELLGEALAGFKLRGGAGGTEGAPAALRELVDHAEHQRQLGADHGQVGLDLIGQRHHRVQALHIDGEALGFLGDAGIAGRAIDLASPRRLGKLPDQRVLAAAAAKNENFHGPRHFSDFQG